MKGRYWIAITFLVGVAIALIHTALGMAFLQGQEAKPFREIVSERGCDYIQLNDKAGRPIHIIEVADQPVTCKYNVFRTEVKKR